MSYQKGGNDFSSDFKTKIPFERGFARFDVQVLDSHSEIHKYCCGEGVLAHGNILLNKYVMAFTIFFRLKNKKIL